MTEQNNRSAAAFKLMLLQLMVLQNSSVVLVGRFTRANVSPADTFVVNHFVFVTEFCKLIASAMLEYKSSGGQLCQSINDHILKQPLDFLRISVPALLYLVQNTLLYLALSNLTAPIFQVTYQSKLLTTALVSVLLLNRKYNLKQWICLTLLGMGVAIVVLGEAAGKDDSRRLQETEQNFTLGLIAVSISCFSSAFAGVYFEKVLKKNSSDSNSTVAPPSLWMRNIQLAFFSVCIAIGNILVTPEEKEFMHGFSTWVWVLVALQAGGGLLVAAVIKYADNVLKGMATGVSVVVSTVWSIIFFGTPLSAQFTVGATIILSSVYFFSNDLPCKKKEIIPPPEHEMKPMLPS